MIKGMLSNYMYKKKIFPATGSCSQSSFPLLLQARDFTTHTNERVIHFNSFLPLNFQFQQALPFQQGFLWTHLPSQIHQLVHNIFNSGSVKECQVLSLHSILLPIHTHTHTHTHTHAIQIHIPMFLKNQPFSGSQGRKSRDNTTQWRTES